MLVVPDGVLNRANVDTCDIDVPAVDVVALGKCVHDTGVDGVAINDLDFREADALLEA